MVLSTLSSNFLNTDWDIRVATEILLILSLILSHYFVACANVNRTLHRFLAPANYDVKSTALSLTIVMNARCEILSFMKNIGTDTL